MTYGIGPEDDPQLRDEHAFLDRQVAEVMQLAEAGDCRSSGVLWEVFSRELEQHLIYEERFLLPEFGRASASASLWAESLRTEHAELRGHCRSLTRDFADPALRRPRLKQLVRRLAEHREREARLLSPWLASLAPQRRCWSPIRLAAQPLREAC